jgi:catechol 2,3-dioxygenase-like lactoylglutathione lyase family enzyme
MNFNHVLLYVSDLAKSLDFYVDKLGFALVEASSEFPYARIRSTNSDTTIALHGLEQGDRPEAPGVRLYFEVAGLDSFCQRLQERGVLLKRLPEEMPWGWRHAYLDDPDGREISLYWAGDKRLTPTGS